MAAVSSKRDYEAEMDADTLASAVAIRSDKKRMSRASKAAGRMAKEQQVKATALKKVSSRAHKPTKRKG